MADFVPQHSAHGGAVIAQQQGAGVVTQGLAYNQQYSQQQAPQAIVDNHEALEMQAFEKGRMQGEMEAMRRLEQDGGLKGAAAPLHQQQMQAAIQQPDVLEINRLTTLQRISYVLGMMTNIAFLVLGLVWIFNYHGGVAVDESAGSNPTFNTMLLCNFLGIFLLANAISNYRALPIRTPPVINRAWYIFLQLACLTLFWLALACWVISSPENNFWSATHWVWAAAATIYTLHALYSITRTLAAPVAGVSYEEWAEVNNKLTVRAPTHHADRTLANDHVRTVYAPAPNTLDIATGRSSMHHNAGAAAHGQNAPIAPPNAPRWAENPRTHAEDFFLLPRARWGVIGFWSMGAAILMIISSAINNLASNGTYWAQRSTNTFVQGDQIDEIGSERRIAGLTALMLLFTMAFVGYAAIPPRATLVKNAFVNDREMARRSSVSHNAETRNSMV